MTFILVMGELQMCLLEGGFATEGLDDITVSFVAPGGSMLHQAQHRLKVAVGRS